MAKPKPETPSKTSRPSARKTRGRSRRRARAARVWRPPVRGKSAPDTDFVAIALAYAQGAVADKKGTWTNVCLRQGAKRFLQDYARAGKRGCAWTFSAKWANRVCQFVELLPHVEDTWDTETLVLQPFQVFFLVNLFGFRIGAGRRFTEALLLVARKNAKSTLAAAVLLVCLCLERVEGAQLLSAATTGAQARIVWGIAKRMIEKTPMLRATFDLRPYANAIARPENGSNFRPINSKASTQDGLNPSHTNLDEVHAHKTHDLLNVLRSAAGARSNPLWLYTTTEGYENAGPWSEIRHMAKLVLKGELTADHLLALVFCVDEADDNFDESVLVKANPLIDANPKLRNEIRKQAINAKAMPGALAEFQIKRLNRSAATAAGWVNLHRWGRGNVPVHVDQLVGKPCYGALDLAGGTDMNAWRLLWLLDEGFATWGRYWVPEEAIQQRTERKSAPYAAWRASGLLQSFEGGTQDYTAITEQILADCERFRPTRVAYDPWNAAQVANSLAAAGIDLVQFRQGPQSYHPALKAMEIAYIAGKLRHGGDPILRWNAANLVVRYDVNLNMAPDRKRSGDKIDGIACLAMCFGLAEADDSAAFEAYLNNIVKG